jgi:hypothetical protein
MKLIADSLSGRSSRAKKPAFPVLVLGAVAGAGLGWVTTAGFLPNLRSSPPAIRPRPGHRRRVHPRRWDGPDPKTTSCPPMQLHSRTRGRSSNAGGWTCRNQSNAQNRLKSFALSRGGAKYYAEQLLTGRIANLVIFRLPEFGTRASFRIDCAGRRPVVCCVAGDVVAREFITHYREGAKVAVTGTHEPRPSTASANTPWAGRFRVHAVRVAEAPVSRHEDDHGPVSCGGLLNHLSQPIGRSGSSPLQSRRQRRFRETAGHASGYG